MRLAEDQIKRGILHPDPKVRSLAVRYFSDAESQDQTIMPLVIQAVEKYDWRSEACAAAIRSGLVQTDETVTWLLQEISREQELSREQKINREIDEEYADDEDDDESRSPYCNALVHLLTRTDPRILMRFQSAIETADCLDDEECQGIAERIELLSADVQTCWAEIEAFCEREAANIWEPVETDRVYRLIEALSRRKEESCVAKVLSILETDAPDADNTPMGWLEPFTVHLAGEMQLESAVPSIVAKLHKEDDDFLQDECGQALLRIGGDAVVESLCAEYDRSAIAFRFCVSSFLERIHSDLAVAKLLELLPQEEDSDLRLWLGQALIRQFSFDAVEPIRQLILGLPLEPELLNLRSDFLAACTLMEAAFPEFDQWLEDSRHDDERRSEFYAKKFGSLFDKFDAEDDEGDANAEDDEDYEHECEDGDDDFYDSPQPIHREQPPVGRNDPCPCGSGKKFKKCCLPKQRRQAEESQSKFPIGTVAYYGPDDKTTTKIAAAVITREGAEPILERWVGRNVKDNPKARREIEAFFKRHHVKSVVTSDGNMGCPHEEGPDFPEGGDCPFCPFWKGKQGSGAAI